MMGIIKFYIYCVSSIILFAGLFVAIPLTYNMENMNEAHAKTEVIKVDELGIELSYLS